MVEELFSSQHEIVNIVLIAIGLLLLMALTIIVFFYLSRKKIIKTQLEKANLEIAYQKELLQATILTQEEERKRIAQDLHDAISSKLNVVSLNANFLIEKDISIEETHRVGDSILKVTKSVLENSRRIAHDLLPPTLEKFGLQAALEELCEEMEAAQQFDLGYNISYDETLLSEEQELHLFRIAQELFNNTIKHAGATHIDLTLKSDKNHVFLQYGDNGKGFEVSEIKNAKGLGMSGIENRVQLINAQYQITSSPGKGTQVTITTRPNEN